MAENLKATKFNDGSDIPLVTNNNEWSGLSTPACGYENDESKYGNTYGAVYNWYAVNAGKLCPKGWHVPSDEEWTLLTDYLGGEEVAGGKLKETGTKHWKSPNSDATNESGFTALPGGYRDGSGTFNYVGSYGYWWSATERGTNTALNRYVGSSSSNVTTYCNNAEIGFSVRCVRD